MVRLPLVELETRWKLDEENPLLVSEILIVPVLIVVCEIKLPDASKTVDVSVKPEALARSMLIVAVCLEGLTVTIAPGTNPKPVRKVTLPLVVSRNKDVIKRKLMGKPVVIPA
jgi:hypothetical protein